MQKLTPFFVGFAVVVQWLAAVPAQATCFIKTYVSNTGNDANPCTFTSPCQSLQPAHDQAGSGGEIVCLNLLGLAGAGLTITKSITIDCGTPAGTQYPSGGNPITINGAGIVVKLRHMSINGMFQGAGSYGIDFQNGAQLLLEDCLVHGFSGTAVFVRPSGPGGQLYITNSIVSDNGIGSGGTGILVQPPASSNVDMVFDHVRVIGNAFGIRVDGGNSASTQLTIKSSVISGSTGNVGLAVTSAGGGPTAAFVESSEIAGNGTGVMTSGNAVVLLKNSVITTNTTALNAAGISAIYSYGNNGINNNGSPGTAPTPVALR